MREALLALVLSASALACEQQRAVGKPPGQSVAPASSAAGAMSSNPSGVGGDGGDGGTSGAGSSGDGGQRPLPEPADCACLAAAGDEGCRSCLDEASLSSCEEAHGACDAIGGGYCELVYDCVALCPTADAFCVDTCLGAQDSSRTTVEAVVACACEQCSGACAAGDCD